jgi:hypothetical protein
MQQFAKLSLRKWRIGSNPILSAIQSVRSSAEEFWSSKPAVGSSNLSGPANRKKMYQVNYKNSQGHDCLATFESLDGAIAHSKTLAKFVTISFAGQQLVGKFGVDSVESGHLPNGDRYTWRKRR